MSKKKRYQKPQYVKPIPIDKQIRNLRNRVESFRQVLSAVTMSYERHMDQLANIAKRDIGNAVQSMFATLQLCKGKIDQQYIDELELSLNNLNSTLSNFGQLIPFNVRESFELPQLMNALVVLTRSDTEVNRIEVKVLYNRGDTTKVYQPFQLILQMLHNFVINAKKSFTEDIADKLIEVESVIEDGNCVISIKNNGRPIEDSVVDRIFDYGFSTTDGSGIGLAHAQWLCDGIGATIELERFVDRFTTVFTIKIPLRDDTEKNNSD